MLCCLLNKSDGHEHDYQLLVYIDVQSFLFVSTFGTMDTIFFIGDHKRSFVY